MRLPVRVFAPSAGFVSLALYDKHGVLTRSMLSAEPVAAGTYRAKGVFFKELPRAQLEMIVGKSGNPPWRTADGKGDWGGNLGFPSSIVAAVQFAAGAMQLKK